MVTQFLIDALKNGEPSAWLELQIELWRQDPTPDNYGKALDAWVEYETKHAAQPNAQASFTEE
jgi:hypothetical protein